MSVVEPGRNLTVAWPTQRAPHVRYDNLRAVRFRGLMNVGFQVSRAERILYRALNPVENLPARFEQDDLVATNSRARLCIKALDRQGVVLPSLVKRSQPRLIGPEGIARR